MKYILLTLLFLLPSASVFGEARMTTLEQRIAILELQNAELYHNPTEKRSAGLADQISEHLTISGLLELEAVAEGRQVQGGNSGSSSDLSLATAQFGFNAEINEQVIGDLILLFEEGEEFTVDEAAINVTNDLWYGRFGLQYLPFGNFFSHFVSDPLSLALGETQETAILVGYRHDLFSLAAFVFNGEAEKVSEGEEHIRDWGMSVSVTPLEHVELGASYLSDLADTDAELPLAVDNGYRTRVGAWSAYAVVGFGAFDLSAEILGATESFSPLDLDIDGNGSGDQPLAWNVELAWSLREHLELAARYAGSSEYAEQPEAEYGLCASWGVWENLSLSLEYLHGEFERNFAPVDASGDQQANRDRVTAQLGIIF